jgi:hypothetical protein
MTGRCRGTQTGQARNTQIDGAEQVHLVLVQDEAELYHTAVRKKDRDTARRGAGWARGKRPDWRQVAAAAAAGSKLGCRRGIAAAAALAAVVVADDGTVGGGARGAERAREIDPDHLTGLQPGDSENERQLRQTAPTGAGARHATKCMSPKPSQRRQRPGNKTHPQHADDAADVHVHGILLLALLIFFLFLLLADSTTVVKEKRKKVARGRKGRDRGGAPPARQ